MKSNKAAKPTRTRKPTKTMRSDIAWSSRDQIGVLGYDLCRDLIGKVSLGDMGFLEITGRLPAAQESKMFNALLVTLVEHGIVPSTLAARMTHAGAPEAMQAAVAAGLLGLGSVFVGSAENAARMLMQALPDPKKQADMRELAVRVVDEYREAGHIIPGLGHPVHKPADPRTTRLFNIARATGFSGPYVELMKRISKRAEKVMQRPLPINATGAIAAIACEMDLPWQACRGIGIMARAVGLVGHVLEESRQPIAMQVWHHTEAEAGSHARGKLRRQKR